MAGKPKRVDAEMLVLRPADNEIAELKERQALIGQCHEVIGQIKAAQMFGKFGDVTSLMWLKQIKDSKIYRDLPGIGTWEKFCKYVGKDRHTVDQDILNLAAFGEEYLVAVTNLQVGYRDLRKLRQLTHDGTVTIDTDAVEIGGERIPFSPEHREDLQAALERVLDEKDKALKDEQKVKKRLLGDKEAVINKQEKRIVELEGKAVGKGLTPDENAYLAQLETLETAFDGHLILIRNAVRDLANVRGERTSAKLIALLNQARMELNAYYDTAVDCYAPKNMLPEEEWIPPFERDKP